MRNVKFSISVVTAVAVATLAACGGGDSGGSIGGGTTVTPGQTVAIVNAPAVDMAVRGGAVLNLVATAESYKANLATMKWTVVAETAGSPDVQLTNADCAGATKNDIKGAAGYSSSTWTCNASTMLPASSKDVAYNITVTGVDGEGLSASSTSRVRVAALPDSALAALLPSVATTSQVTVRGGTEAGLTCFGSPGAGTVSKALTYSWQLKSNPNGAAFSLSDADKSTVRFTAPAVVEGSPIRAVFECAVTDASGNKATADVNVTVSSNADFTPAPTAGAPGTVTMYSGVETLLSCVGTGGYLADTGGRLSYQWVVKENPAGIPMELTGATQADVRVRPGTLPAAVGTSSSVVLQCRVTDDANRTAIVDVQGTVFRSDSSTAPSTVIADAGATQRVNAGQIVTLNAGGSYAVGNTNAQLYYAWTQVSGSPVSISNANAASASFSAPTISTSATMRFKVVVSNQPITTGYVPKSTETAYVDVIVGGVAEPRIFLPPVQEVLTNASVSIYASVLDNPENKPVYYRWTQISGSPVTLQTPNLNGVSFFAPATTGEVVLRVQASFLPTFPSGATASADAILRVK